VASLVRGGDSPVMKAYLFGNRRRLTCLYGAPGDPAQLIPNVIYRGIKATTPAWAFGAGQSIFAIRHESRGIPFLAELPFGSCELASGVIKATRKDDRFDLVGITSKALDVAEGRRMPSVLADCTLAQMPKTSFLNNSSYGTAGATEEPLGDLYNVVAARHGGGLICFLEKTIGGYGQRFVRLALRRLEPIAPTVAFPLNGASSRIDTAVSLFTISEVVGNNETTLYSALVPILQVEGFDYFEWQKSAVARVALGKDEEGQSVLYASVAIGFGNLGDTWWALNSGGWCVHTAVVPYSPPSVDATVFGAIKSPAGPSGAIAPSFVHGYFRSSVGATYGSSSGDSGLRIKLCKHGTLSDVAFVAGATGRPDTDSSFAVSTRRGDLIKSELANRVVTASVRCGADAVAEAPSAEGDSSQLSPIVQFAGVREPFLAEMFPAAHAKVNCQALATTAHITDSSGLSSHSAFLHHAPQDGIYLLGKKFSSAVIKIVARGQGFIPGNNVEGNPYVISVPENQDIDLATFFGFFRSYFAPSSYVGYQSPYDFYAMPLGEFECEPFSVGSAQSSPGLLRGESQQINQPFNVRRNSGTEWSGLFESRAEIAAVFTVGLQEYGAYSARDFLIRQGFDGLNAATQGVSDSDYLNAVQPSPLSPIGQIVDRAFFSGDKQPSPVLMLRLLARTVTKVTVSDSFDQETGAPAYGWEQTNESRPTLVSLGTFIFSKQQTDSLLNGDEVAPTTWRTATAQEPERPDSGANIDLGGVPLSQWPQAYFPAGLTSARFWLNFKVRLNVEDDE